MQVGTLQDNVTRTTMIVLCFALITVGLLLSDRVSAIGDEIEFHQHQNTDFTDEISE